MKPKKDAKDVKIKELTDTLQRLQAEFENFKKRCDKDNTSFREYVNAELIGNLLPIIDSFQMALKNTGKQDFIKGVELIFSQFYEALEREGLRPINVKDEKFDPYKHEVLLTEKTDKEEEDDLIIEELHTGYMLKDKVLRYAKVKVKKYDNSKHATKGSHQTGKDVPEKK